MGQVGPPYRTPSPWTGGAILESQQVGRLLDWPPGQAGGRSQTTFLERAGWGFMAGALLALGTAALTGDEGFDEGNTAAYVAYAGGSALGVILVTAHPKREGARPLRAMAGAAVGLAIPGLLLGWSDHPEGPTGGDLVRGLGFLLLPPLGAALGHVVGTH